MTMKLLLYFYEPLELVHVIHSQKHCAIPEDCIFVQTCVPLRVGDDKSVIAVVAVATVGAGVPLLTTAAVAGVIVTVFVVGNNCSTITDNEITILLL